MSFLYKLKSIKIVGGNGIAPGRLQRSRAPYRRFIHPNAGYRLTPPIKVKCSLEESPKHGKCQLDRCNVPQRDKKLKIDL